VGRRKEEKVNHSPEKQKRKKKEGNDFGLPRKKKGNLFTHNFCKNLMNDRIVVAGGGKDHKREKKEEGNVACPGLSRRRKAAHIISPSTAELGLIDKRGEKAPTFPDTPLFIRRMEKDLLLPA